MLLNQSIISARLNEKHKINKVNKETPIQVEKHKHKIKLKKQYDNKANPDSGIKRKIKINPIPETRNRREKPYLIAARPDFGRWVIRNEGRKETKWRER